jgi:hypothetical protein
MVQAGQHLADELDALAPGVAGRLLPRHGDGDLATEQDVAPASRQHRPGAR